MALYTGCVSGPSSSLRSSESYCNHHPYVKWLGYAAAVEAGGPVALLNTDPCIKSMLELLRARLADQGEAKVRRWIGNCCSGNRLMYQNRKEEGGRTERVSKP
jgi:hypothetical protein